MDVDPAKLNLPGTGASSPAPGTNGANITPNNNQSQSSTTGYLMSAFTNLAARLEALRDAKKAAQGPDGDNIIAQQGAVNLVDPNGEMLRPTKSLVAKANYAVEPKAPESLTQIPSSPAPAQPNPPTQTTNNPPPSPAKPAAPPKKNNGILLGPVMNFVKGALQGLAQGFKNVPKIIGRLFGRK